MSSDDQGEDMRKVLAVSTVAVALVLGACGTETATVPAASTGSYSARSGTGSYSGSSGGGYSGSSSDDDDYSYEEPEPDPDEMADAYKRAYEDACEEVWSNSPDGNLYYDGNAYTADDCMDEMPSVDGSEFEDEDDAASRGGKEGYDGAFETSPSETLCWGTDCWDESDY